MVRSSPRAGSVHFLTPELESVLEALGGVPSMKRVQCMEQSVVRSKAGMSIPDCDNLLDGSRVESFSRRRPRRADLGHRYMGTVVPWIETNMRSVKAWTIGATKSRVPRFESSSDQVEF